MSNYFAMESEIVDRLRSQVPELVEVYTPFDISDMVELGQVVPAAHVIYRGDTLSDDVGRGRAVMVTQSWLVVLVVQNSASQMQDTTQIRVDAGLIVSKILAALQGWQPESSTRPLKRVNGVPAGYSAGFSYFPFAFEGELITS